MNTHACDPEALALLACSALDAKEAKDIRHHLEGCPACRNHFAELKALCESHMAASGALPEIEGALRVCLRVASAIRSSEEREPTPRAGLWPAPWFRRMAATAAMLIMATAGVMLFRPSLSPTGDAVPQVLQAPARSASGHSANKLIAYRIALSRSPEELERLLSEEATRPTVGLQNPIRLGPAMAESDL